jgi:phytanoyl-CoA hydroxylase
VVKQPRIGSPVPWHQDPPYGGNADRTTTFAVPNFTTDIYLDDSTRENGCVWAIPHHHLIGHVELTSDQERCFNHPLATPIELKAGDVLFHCLSAPHGSRNNGSEKIRRTFYLHYLCQEVFEDAYATWPNVPKAWGDAKRDQLIDFMASRDRLGFASTTAAGTVRLGEGGFTVQAAAMSTRDEWARRAAAIPTAQIPGMKALTWRPAATAIG